MELFNLSPQGDLTIFADLGISLILLKVNFFFFRLSLDIFVV